MPDSFLAFFSFFFAIWGPPSFTLPPVGATGNRAVRPPNLGRGIQSGGTLDKALILCASRHPWGSLSEGGGNSPAEAVSHAREEGIRKAMARDAPQGLRVYEVQESE